MVTGPMLRDGITNLRPHRHRALLLSLLRLLPVVYLLDRDLPQPLDKLPSTQDKQAIPLVSMFSELASLLLLPKLSLSCHTMKSRLLSSSGLG